jgi:hypothetical protein
VTINPQGLATGAPGPAPAAAGAASDCTYNLW